MFELLFGGGACSWVWLEEPLTLLHTDSVCSFHSSFFLPLSAINLKYATKVLPLSIHSLSVHWVGGANGPRGGGGEDKQKTCLFFHLGRKIEMVLVGRERGRGISGGRGRGVAAGVGEGGE